MSLDPSDISKPLKEMYPFFDPNALISIFSPYEISGDGHPKDTGASGQNKRVIGISSS